MKNQIYLISNELIQLGNNLGLIIDKLKNEVDEYTNNYCEERFIAPEKINDKNEMKKVIQKGETIFDKVNETVLRNDILIELEKYIEDVLKLFSTKIKEFKENILQEKKKLIETNNEIVDNLKKLEKMNLVDNDLNDDIFKRKTIEEEEKERNQLKTHEKLKDIITLEEMKRLEEWTDIPIDSIVYDSNTEGIENCGYEGSTFQNSVLNKENIIFYFESEEGDRFGYFMKQKIERLGEYINDKNGFLFTLKNEIRKIEIKNNLFLIVHYPPKKELIELSSNNIIIMKGKEKQSTYESL